MFVKLAKGMTSYFIRKKIVDEQEREIYEYCFEILISTVANFLLLLIIGLAIRRIHETIVFSVCFMMLRGVMGGYHADTHLLCMLTLLIVYSGSIGILYVDISISQTLSYFLMSFSLFVFLILAPVDSENKPLSKRERRYARKKIFIVMGIIVAIFTVFSVFAITKQFAVIVAYVCVAISFSMIIGQIKNLRNNKLGIMVAEE